MKYPTFDFCLSNVDRETAYAVSLVRHSMEILKNLPWYEAIKSNCTTLSMTAYDKFEVGSNLSQDEYRALILIKLLGEVQLVANIHSENNHD
jgi:hypothetical protein